MQKRVGIRHVWGRGVEIGWARDGDAAPERKQWRTRFEEGGSEIEGDDMVQRDAIGMLVRRIFN